MHDHPGKLIRDARERNGVSQAQLARRAGTTQSVISRLEHGQRSPTIDTLERLLLVLGEELVLTSRRYDAPHSPEQVRRSKALPVADRLERALHWNSFAAEVATAGAEQRNRRT